MLDKNNYDSFFIKLLLEICAGSIGLLPLITSLEKWWKSEDDWKERKNVDTSVSSE